MGCPVHIWLPAMAALAPFARVARDRVRSFRIRSESRPRSNVRVVQRFAPVGAANAAAAEATESERAR
jgi:hypothetical protein